MADKDDKKDSKSAPGFDPKPVQLGGESIVDRLYPHRKKIAVFLVSGFAIWGVIALVIHFRDNKREKQTTELALVLDTAQHQVRDPSVPADPKSKDPTFADAKDRANQILDSLTKHQTSAAGPTYRASLLVQAGKLDEAIAEYRKGTTAAGLDGVLAREGLGLAQEMKAEAEKDPSARQKGLEVALSTFEGMQPDEQGARRAFALYHQARVQALLGQKDKAKAAFEKAKELGKGTELPDMIDERLATL